MLLFISFLSLILILTFFLLVLDEIQNHIYICNKLQASKRVFLQRIAA